MFIPSLYCLINRQPQFATCWDTLSALQLHRTYLRLLDRVSKIGRLGVLVLSQSHSVLLQTSKSSRFGDNLCCLSLHVWVYSLAYFLVTALKSSTDIISGRILLREIVIGNLDWYNFWKNSFLTMTDFFEFDIYFIPSFLHSFIPSLYCLINRQPQFATCWDTLSALQLHLTYLRLLDRVSETDRLGLLVLSHCHSVLHQTSKSSRLGDNPCCLSLHVWIEILNIFW